MQIFLDNAPEMQVREGWIGCIHTIHGVKIYWPKRKWESAASKTSIDASSINRTQLIEATVKLRHLRCFDLLPYRQRNNQTEGTETEMMSRRCLKESSTTEVRVADLSLSSELSPPRRPRGDSGGAAPLAQAPAPSSPAHHRRSSPVEALSAAMRAAAGALHPSLASPTNSSAPPLLFPCRSCARSWWPPPFPYAGVQIRPRQARIQRFPAR